MHDYDLMADGYSLTHTSGRLYVEDMLKEVARRLGRVRRVSGGSVSSQGSIDHDVAGTSTPKKITPLVATKSVEEDSRYPVMIADQTLSVTLLLPLG